MRQLVFVDDDEAVLGGLRRVLHARRGDWQMRFVADAPAALAALEQQPADVVVTDMHIPGMDGPAVLAEIRRRWPETVRIVLSGSTNEKSALRTVTVAHRFLSKPCDPRFLVDVIGNALRLQERLGSPDLQRLISRIGTLPSPPRTYTAICEALNRPDVNPELVASIIECDAGCSAKLLQLVNSAFFGLARQVSKVQDAVVYLGMGRVHTLALAADATGVFTSVDPQFEQLVTQVNDRGHQVGMDSRRRAGEHGHDAFVAGMLHDIGQLVLASVRPDAYPDLVAETAASGGSLVEAERAEFGGAHPEVGGYLLQLWGLPYGLVEAVARHHDCGATEHPDAVVASVAAAAASAASD